MVYSTQNYHHTQIAMPKATRVSNVPVGEKQELKDAALVDATRIQRKTVFVQNLGATALALKCPLPISLEVTATNVVAYFCDLDELAVSSSESEVLDEMRATIVETYFLLKSEQEHLGPLQHRHWEFLKQIISEV